MKIRRRLKLTLMILICILISLVGFIGIYTKQLNSYSNILPSYQLASDLKGSTILELEVDDSTETIYYDAEGNEVDSTEITDENEAEYTSEEVKVNPDENLTKENYDATLKILKERLEFLQADQYSLDLDETTGKIVLTFEDDYPEDIESILPMEGKLELVDSNTSDVILDYTDVKSAEATYASTENGYTVYINLKLEDTGIDKINNIEGYKNSTDDNGEVTTNNFTVEFDEEELEEVSYDDMVLTGKTLRIAIGSDITSSSTVNSTLNTATVVSRLTTIGKTPVVYNITAEEYVKSSININVIYGLIAVFSVITVIFMVYIIVKYKSSGLLVSIATIANIALFSILIRITNITISLNSFVGILAFLIIDFYLGIKILKEIKNQDGKMGNIIKVAYLNAIDVLTISLILIVVFSFSQMTVISSMGLVLFWGWLVVVLGNLLLTVPMLSIGGKK